VSHPIGGLVLVKAAITGCIPFSERKGGINECAARFSAVEAVVAEARNSSWRQHDFIKNLGHDSFAAACPDLMQSKAWSDAKRWVMKVQWQSALG
jgi:hypothetical protein